MSIPSSGFSRDDAFSKALERLKALGVDSNKSFFFLEPKVGKKWKFASLVARVF